MLQRSSQVGEFYRMMPPPVWNKTKQLPAEYMDLLIYDEESDQLKHISFAQALFATGYDASAVAGDAGDLFGFGAAGYTFIRPQNAAGVAIDLGLVPADFMGMGNAEVALPLAVTSMTPLTTLLYLVSKGVWLPMCITICRPFIEHLMMSCVATVSGRDTGATLFGPADMQISANTSVKTIEGHYTCDATNNSNLILPPWDPCPAYTLEHNTPPSAGATRSR